MLDDDGDAGDAGDDTSDCRSLSVGDSQTCFDMLRHEMLDWSNIIHL